MRDRDQSNLKASLFAALALAFASFGDAFLYPFLPMNFEEVGVPVIWVGVLLSVNRFVRIISNILVVHACAKYGLRTIMITAVALALTSTLGYGLATGIIFWLLFRMIWGLAFSAMRIGTLGYALQDNRQGVALGLSRGLQESGPVIVLFIAPLLLANFETKYIFFILTTLSVPALYFAFRLPRKDDRTQAVTSTAILKWPSTLNSITLVSAIVIDGIIVVVLGILFFQYRTDINVIAATALAALYLGYRRVCFVLLSPCGGWIADKIGLQTVFNVSALMVVVGLVVIVTGWIGTGAVIVFTFYSINAAITPGSVSRNKSHSLAAVAENATWRDIGAAIGTLMGGFLIASENLVAILMVATFVMSALLFIHLRMQRGSFKLLSYGSSNNL